MVRVSEKRRIRQPTAIISSAVLDIAFVTLFAAAGRGSHHEEASLAGLWQTAWPFLAGLAIAWIGMRIWRRPTSILYAGLPAWIGSVAIGMLLRVLFTDGGAALPFVLVATGVLGATLLGWRAIVALVAKLAGARRRKSER